MYLSKIIINEYEKNRKKMAKYARAFRMVSCVG
jgi:hypothetical protein